MRHLLLFFEVPRVSRLLMLQMLRVVSRVRLFLLGPSFVLRLPLTARRLGATIGVIPVCTEDALPVVGLLLLLLGQPIRQIYSLLRGLVITAVDVVGVAWVRRPIEDSALSRIVSLVQLVDVLGEALRALVKIIIVQSHFAWIVLLAHHLVVVILLAVADQLLLVRSL
jgi:hypothetical protein